MSALSHSNAVTRLRFSLAMAGLLTTTAFTHPSQAQTQQTAQAQSVEEIVVTGTRIIRDGYEAPTPVEVLSMEDLNAQAQPNIADAVNRLPALQGSLGPQNADTNVSSGTGGVNQLNLRALGPVRTLVLLDSKRVVGATLAGFVNNGSAVDVNGFPGGLISRVDVVTGGASAVYGSDALAGVVNFVLDKTYTGIKGELQGGITSFGDDPNGKVSLTGGAPFANGRGHVLFFAEHTYDKGISGNPRPWRASSYVMDLNPAYVPGNGLPQYTLQSDVGLSLATPGGLILNTALRGTQFLQNGAPAKFNFGTISGSGLLMSGGDWQQSRIDQYPTLLLRVNRSNLFFRSSYDLTDDVSAYAEASWAYTRAQNFSLVPTFRLGNISVKSDNAFIPASIKAQMTAQGITGFTMGSTLADGPYIGADNGRTLRRYVGGLEGKTDAFGTNWKWDAYATRSQTHNSTRATNDLIPAKFNQAADAVLNPGTGQIVCRSTLTNANDGCVPYDVFGIGVNAPAAVKYVQGTGYSMTVLTQDVLQATATGDVASTWAGPVSLAIGLEHRNESVKGYATPLDIAHGYFAGNYSATNASYNVTEGSLETVIPLAKNTGWAKSLDLNAAARGTGYSASGYVTTWKVGATYVPIDELTFRATRSRDIRAPNLGDLYNAGRAGTGNVNDPFTKTSVTITDSVQGNPNLKPEEADTTGLGVVISPKFFPGFTASVDYYNIDIGGAIVSLSDQQYLDRCFAGATAYCSFIQRNPAGVITIIFEQPANALEQKTDGLDFEASYRLPLENINSNWSGSLAIHGLATYVFKLQTIDNDPIHGLVTIDGAGVNGVGSFGQGNVIFTEHFRYTVSATLDLNPFSGTLTMHGLGPGKYSNEAIQCTSGCPAATDTHPTLDNNHIAGANYFDLALNYKLFDGHSEVFFVTQNMFNKYPARVAGPSDSGFYSGMGNSDYDRIGRMFRAGVRFKM
jgi:iron complex outermembrane receptor protein